MRLALTGHYCPSPTLASFFLFCSEKGEDREDSLMYLLIESVAKTRPCRSISQHYFSFTFTNVAIVVLFAVLSKGVTEGRVAVLFKRLCPIGSGSKYL